MSESLISTVPVMSINEQESLYLLVDGSQIEELAKKLYAISGDLNLEAIYLFEPYLELQSVSPYLIQVTDSVKQWFLNLNQPTLGFFFSSPLVLRRVAENLRTLIKAETPYGSSVFVKFANSECAHVLLSTHSPHLWQAMNKVWLPTRYGWQHLTKPESLPQVSREQHKFNDEQWKLMGKITWRNSLDKIETHMLQWFPERYQQYFLQPQSLEEQAQGAYQLGFGSERDLLLFFNVIGFLGLEAIASDQAYPEIYQLIHQSSQQTPSQRIEQAAELAFRCSQPQEKQ